MAEELPVITEIYERKVMQEQGLNAILAVGDSADNPPAMVVLCYDGDPDSDKRIGLIGKGVTVDTSGYCLKSAGSMGGTKRDMSGEAAGALCAIAACGLHANVTAVIPIAENRLSPGSLIPGDVITSFSGKTIEVLNTDTEGRLILADALTWAVRQEGCTHLVDIATLKGAVYTMFGHVATGSMSNDDAWYAQFGKAAVRSGEKFWRLPAFEEYEKLIESDFADVRNTGIEHYRMQKYAPNAGYVQFMFNVLCPQSFYGIYDWWRLPKAGADAVLESNMPEHVPGHPERMSHELGMRLYNA